MQKDLYYSKFHIIFVSVFHRILDFKAGLDFYPGPFYFAGGDVEGKRWTGKGK